MECGNWHFIWQVCPKRCAKLKLVGFEIQERNVDLLINPIYMYLAQIVFLLMVIAFALVLILGRFAEEKGGR